MERVRIYFRKCTNELEDIFKSSMDSIDILNNLSLELNHRTTKAAHSLAEKVKNRMLELTSSSPGAKVKPLEHKKNEARIKITTSMINGLPEIISNWWDKTCKDNKISSEMLDKSVTGSHIIELARNAIDYSDEVRVIVELSRHCINIVVEDNGIGFDNPLRDIDKSMGGGFGLHGVFDFADLFTLETKGRKYEKINIYLAETGKSKIERGTRITCVKVLNMELDCRCL